MSQGGLRCVEVRDLLVDHHYGEVEGEQRALIEDHIEQCDECAAESEALVQTLSLTRNITAPPLPEEVRERLWARVEGRKAGALEALWSVFSPMFLGVGTCLVSLYPLHHFGLLARMDRGILVLGAVIWASLYNSVFTSILHHARLRRLLAPASRPGQDAPMGAVQEPEESRGVRIQSVVYGLLVSFTGIFWATLLVLGPGAHRVSRIDTALGMTGLSLVVLGTVGLGIGVYERKHAYATSALVASIFCALGTPALYMISHGAIDPQEVLVGTLSIMAICQMGTFVGAQLHLGDEAVPRPEKPELG